MVLHSGDRRPGAANGEIMKDNFTHKETENILSDIQKWYRKEIYKAADRAGGLIMLAIRLEFTEKYLYRLLKRNSFSALRRVVKKIYKEEE